MLDLEVFVGEVPKKHKYKDYRPDAYLKTFRHCLIAPLVGDYKLAQLKSIHTIKETQMLNSFLSTTAVQVCDRSSWRMLT